MPVELLTATTTSYRINSMRTSRAKFLVLKFNASYTSLSGETGVWLSTCKMHCLLVNLIWCACKINRKGRWATPNEWNRKTHLLVLSQKILVRCPLTTRWVVFCCTFHINKKKWPCLTAFSSFNLIHFRHLKVKRHFDVSYSM